MALIPAIKMARRISNVNETVEIRPVVSRAPKTF